MALVAVALGAPIAAAPRALLTSRAHMGAFSGSLKPDWPTDGLKGALPFGLSRAINYQGTSVSMEALLNSTMSDDQKRTFFKGVARVELILLAHVVLDKSTVAVSDRPYLFELGDRRPGLFRMSVDTGGRVILFTSDARVRDYFKSVGRPGLALDEMVLVIRSEGVVQLLSGPPVLAFVVNPGSDREAFFTGRDTQVWRGMSP